MEVLLAQLEKTPARVQENCRARTMVLDEQGAVVGLVAKSEGQLLAVRSRCGVILSAGGFAMNRQMIEKYAPRLQRCNYPIGNPGDNGLGVRLGMGVGGAAINMHEAFTSLPFYPPEELVFGIFVNDQGQRFVAEDTYHGRVGEAYSQPARQPHFPDCRQ